MIHCAYVLRLDSEAGVSSATRLANQVFFFFFMGLGSFKIATCSRGRCQNAGRSLILRRRNRISICPVTATIWTRRSWLEKRTKKGHRKLRREKNSLNKPWRKVVKVARKIYCTSFNWAMDTEKGIKNMQNHKAIT